MSIHYQYSVPHCISVVILYFSIANTFPCRLYIFKTIVNHLPIITFYQKHGEKCQIRNIVFGMCYLPSTQTLNKQLNKKLQCYFLLLFIMSIYWFQVLTIDSTKGAQVTTENGNMICMINQRRKTTDQLVPHNKLLSVSRSIVLEDGSQHSPKSNNQ